MAMGRGGGVVRGGEARGGEGESLRKIASGQMIGDYLAHAVILSSSVSRVWEALSHLCKRRQPGVCKDRDELVKQPVFSALLPLACSVSHTGFRDSQPKRPADRLGLPVHSATCTAAFYVFDHPI